jgi:hypothetical protein
MGKAQTLEMQGRSGKPFRRLTRIEFATLAAVA